MLQIIKFDRSHTQNHYQKVLNPLHVFLKDDYNYIRLLYLENMDLFIHHLMLNLKKTMSFSNIFYILNCILFMIFYPFILCEYEISLQQKWYLMNTIIPIHEKIITKREKESKDQGSRLKWLHYLMGILVLSYYSRRLMYMALFHE